MKRSYDKFHDEYENLYRIRYYNYKNNELLIDCAAAVPSVGPFMKEKVPEGKDCARAFPKSSAISYENEKFREERIHIVDPYFLKIFSFPLILGDIETALSEPNQVVISETAAVKYLGFESPESAVNQKVFLGREQKPIIGVVSNYHQMSVKSAISPIVFPLVTGRANFFTIKLDKGNYQEILEEVKFTYEQFFPGNPFDYFFLDSFFNRQYVNEQKLSKVFTLFAIFAIIVACLGVFGLSSYSALKRTKEIGIRKVLGANINNIVFLLSREFLQLVLWGNLIAWPLVYFFMDHWLDNFTTRISISILVFLLAAILVFVITMITVGYKTLSAARTNPVKALRYE